MLTAHHEIEYTSPDYATLDEMLNDLETELAGYYDAMEESWTPPDRQKIIDHMSKNVGMVYTYFNDGGPATMTYIINRHPLSRV